MRTMLLQVLSHSKQSILEAKLCDESQHCVVAVEEISRCREGFAWKCVVGKEKQVLCCTRGGRLCPSTKYGYVRGFGEERMHLMQM